MIARPLANQRGSSTLELVIWAPVLLLILSVIIYTGRVAQAKQTVQAAASTMTSAGNPSGSRADPVSSGRDARVGRWLQRRLPTDRIRIPTADLAVLGMTGSQYVGQKVIMGSIGLLFPTVFTAMAAALGVTLPITVPVVAGLGLGALLWTTPLDVKRRAAAAREDFRRAISAYIDLTALERQAAGGTGQSLEAAAQVGDSWVFVRIREKLNRARLAGHAPWDALTELGDELQVAALSDLGDIMRLAGEEGIAVSDALRARAASSRDAVLADDHARANQANEALAMPVAALGIVFLALLASPAILRIAVGS